MSADELAIRELISTWMRESQTGNIATVLPLMAEDAAFLRPGCPVMRGREAFAAASYGMNPKMQMEAQQEIIEIVVSGDLASCWSQLTVTVSFPNKPPISRSGPILTVFRRNAQGAWELFRDANMLTLVS